MVIDEAHKFLAAARSMYGLELTDAELPELAREIHTLTTGKSNGGVNVHRLAKKLAEQSGRLFERLDANIPDDSDDDAERFNAVMDDDVSHHLSNIAGIASDLSAAVEDSHVPTLYKERQASLLRVM